MLLDTKLSKLYSVDMFRHDPNYEDPLNFSQELFDDLYAAVKSRLARFGDRSQLVRAESADAAGVVPDELDFVYIDANHSYEGVSRDLRIWARKVREGGVIGGHDYGHPDLPGVKRAIDEFVDRFGWQTHEEGEGVWWTIRRRLHVSFIVPAYNCQTTVQETLESIVSNNLQEEDEIIIVDDSSTDDTSRVLDRLRNEHPSIRLVSHRHNRGTAAAARNTGIEAASYDLIFCLDADNLLVGPSIPSLVNRLFTSGAEAASFGEIHYFQADPAHTTHKWVFTEEVTLADALASVIWPGPSGNYLFTRRSWLRAGRYHEPYLENRSLDSWMFAIRQLGTGTRFVTLPGTWYCHRYGHESHYVQNWQRGNQSLAGLMGLIPLLDLLEGDDVEYLFSKEGRYSWYDRLEERPIHVKNQDGGRSGKVAQVKLPLTWRARQHAASVIEELARRLRSPGQR